jgi:hypothetical protein
MSFAHRSARRFFMLACASLAAFVGARAASAVVVSPGGTVAISGTNFPGLVIQDVFRSVTLTDGTVITLQDRITQVASGHLSFDRIIRNTSNVTINIKDLVETGFAGWTTDVDFDPTSTGIVVEPHTATRDAAGISVTFTNMVSPALSPSPIATPTSLSRAMTDLTNAFNFSLTGTTTIDAFAVTGAPISGTVTTFAPAVPEPGSFALLGANSLLLLRRRRRH